MYNSYRPRTDIVYDEDEDVYSGFTPSRRFDISKYKQVDDTEEEYSEEEYSEEEDEEEVDDDDEAELEEENVATHEPSQPQSKRFGTNRNPDTDWARKRFLDKIRPLKDKHIQENTQDLSPENSQTPVHTFNLYGKQLDLSYLQKSTTIQNRKKVTIYLDNDLAELISRLKKHKLINSYSELVSHALAEYLDNHQVTD